MLVKYVAAFGSQFQHPLGELVVVLLLLDGVVESGVTEVFLAVGNKKFFELFGDEVKVCRGEHSVKLKAVSG